MEKFQEARQRAEHYIKIADHMLYVTYSLVKDDKLLISVLENIFLALANSIASVLYYERLFKRIPAFHDTFESKLDIYKHKISPRYNINKSYIALLNRVYELVSEHKHSSVEFIRKGKFVICSSDYRVKTVELDELKEFVRKAKELIKLNNRMVEKNEYIFK